jgi:hypothetical protein
MIVKDAPLLEDAVGNNADACEMPLGIGVEALIQDSVTRIRGHFIGEGLL